MGLLDLPGPLFDAVDALLGGLLPPLIRLALWGVFAGWLTMLVYRRLSNQERIGRLKAEQKAQQLRIAEFDGEFHELLPLIRDALKTGVRQLGLALVPASLATVPVVFLIVWVAGAYAYRLPEPVAAIGITTEPVNAEILWDPAGAATAGDSGWTLNWPGPGLSATLTDGRAPLLRFPLEYPVPVIHQRRWWNVLVANPLGYLPDDGGIEVIHFALPEQRYLGFGPDWMQGWMFSFFAAFLASSVFFKLLLRID